ELARPPLFSCVLLDADTEGVLLFSFNHLIVDAWALAILQRELVLTWHALGRGDVPAFEPLDLSASEHATAMHEELAPIFKRGREAYPPWPPDAYRLPLDHPAPVAPRREGTIVTRRVDAAFLTRIRAATADAGVPLTAALVAAFQYALHRHARRPDVAFTVVRSGRSSRALREVVAYLSYGDTVEGRLVPGETWAALLERAGRIVLDESSERVPYNLIVQPPSMRVVLNVHNFTSNAAETAPFHYEHENRHPYLWPVWDLFFQILPVDGALLVEVLYRDQVLRSETVAQLWGSFERALTALTETPSAEISAEVD
ncbi:MAG TPA: condensation domain-containing protein, partial [Polyangiaceae bacterium]|nr:condensation domain-containing protein [Polyangiaceae bacterium]